jgi:hypothetical protein
MRRLILLSSMAFSSAFADPPNVVIYPTVAGTNLRSYTQPGYVIEGNHAYPTLPGTSLRDFTERGYVREGNAVYPTINGTELLDFTEYGYLIEEEN